jgi:hypothetical protein
MATSENSVLEIEMFYQNIQSFNFIEFDGDRY